MKSLLALSKLKLAGLIAIVSILVAGTVVAYNIATPSKTADNSTQTEQVSAPEKTSNQADNSEQVKSTPENQTVSESTDSTSARTTAQTPKNTTTQPTQTPTTPQQTTTTTIAPTPVTAPTCNETMKSSYTSLYNSKVNAENASWYNQIEAWNNDAARRGASFSGYVQGMINDNKPAHDARLAQLQTQYYQNLASINCNP